MINNVNGSIKQTLTERLIRVYEGKPWYGKNVLAILDLPTQGLREEGLAILKHMISWRNYVSAVLKGKEFKIEINSEKDWPRVTGNASEIIEEYALSQKELLAAIDQVAEKDWFNRPDGARFSNYELCMGVIDHDIYHAGQIALIAKR